MILFACPAFAPMAHELSAEASLCLGEASLARYPNGELHASLHTRVAGEACLLLGTLAPPDEQALSFLLLSHTLQKEGARTVTALLPYLAYARHDRPEAGESLATAWIGRLLQASGITKVMTVDVHSPAAQELFPIPLVSLSPAILFAQEIKHLALLRATLVAPDEGARDRCRAVARAAGMSEEITVFQKERTAAGVVHQGISGSVGPHAVIVDDILDTGGTLLSCCEQLCQRGVQTITIMVTHGQFTGTLWQQLWSLRVQRIICTDTIPQPPERCSPQMKVLSVLPVLLEPLEQSCER
ncbi:MAG TPA: ribose-phosphate diphosphokinase [Ktedonobacteraceae bacterium]|nr:ribose-phosphate diphosphokinase [Ktedonobacteraceae bacterium]